jgi:arginine decarboxylase
MRTETISASSTGAARATRTIHTCSGVGTGPTKLSAFDGALRGAGIHNYNLLLLSSVIPPGSVVTTDRGSLDAGLIRGEWGDRLYVVMAEERTDVVGAEVWAGIGWVQDDSGRGLFVEHHGSSEASVRDDIEASLGALVRGRGLPFGPVQMRVQGGICTGEPVSAMVAAVYKAEPW